MGVARGGRWGLLFDLDGMTQTFTLAHFTDVHLAPIVGFSPRYWNVKRGLGFLNWHVKRHGVHQRAIVDRLMDDAKSLRPDHIAITGDLANLGLPEELAAARRWLEDIGPPEAVTVIPGNHDIYSTMHGDIGVARWAAYMGGEAETLAFPFVRRLGAIAIIGMNSAIETPPFVAAGRLGGDQIEVARDLLQRLHDDAVVRVVLIHHPPLPGMATERRALKDARHFQQMLIKSGAEVVLYGHNHKEDLRWLTAATGRVALIGGASASAARPYRDDALARYNLLTFFRTGGRLRVRQVVRGIESGDGPVVQISERVLEGFGPG